MKRHGIGIKARLFFQVASIMVVCIAMLLFFNSTYLESVYMWNSRRAINAAVEEFEQTQNIELTYYSKLPAYEQELGASIELYNTRDEMIYRSADAIDYSSKKINVLSRDETGKDGGYWSVLQEEDSSVQYVVYGRMLSNGYFIEVSKLFSPMTESARVATRFTAALAVLGLLGSLIVISLFARRFTKPLIEMNNITGEMASLKFTRKCSAVRKDELGALADNINRLSDTLDSTLRELNEKNAKLLEDIEFERKLDAARREFISSVSHELKTPIAVIRGYAEGLEALDDGESGKTAEYSGIIMSEADRMNTMVMQLLELSRYESGGYTLNSESFDMHELAQEYLAANSLRLAENGVTVENTIPDSTLCYGDRERLYTVFNNYVSNAVSHVSGERIIRCRSQECGDYYRIYVFNTGAQIPDEDSEKLFMSFYRGDKAHSRSEGRFGLGLSIVKAITELHGRACGFENTSDGVEFWFDVDKADENNKSEIEEKNED